MSEKNRTVSGRKPGTFPPGKSGNPRGRPVEALSEYVHRETRNGGELADILLDFARGKTIAFTTDDGSEKSITPGFKDRISAIGELRQMGRFPVSPVDLNVAGGLKRDDLSQYTAEELRNFLKKLQESRCPPKPGEPLAEKATP